MPHQHDFAHHLTKEFVKLMIQKGVSTEIEELITSQEFEISFYANLMDASLWHLQQTLEHEGLLVESVQLRNMLEKKTDESKELAEFLTTLYTTRPDFAEKASVGMIEEFTKKCAEYGIVIKKRAGLYE